MRNHLVPELLSYFINKEILPLRPPAFLLFFPVLTNHLVFPDVTKALNARKQEKMRKDQAELIKQHEQQQKHRQRLQHSKTVEEGAAQVLDSSILLSIMILHRRNEQLQTSYCN